MACLSRSPDNTVERWKKRDGEFYQDDAVRFLDLE